MFSLVNKLHLAKLGMMKQIKSQSPKLDRRNIGSLLKNVRLHNAAIKAAGSIKPVTENVNFAASLANIFKNKANIKKIILKPFATLRAVSNLLPTSPDRSVKTNYKNPQV